MNDHFPMLNQSQACQSPYIMTVIDMSVCKIHDRYINDGTMGARSFAASLKQKLRGAHDILHQTTTVYVEVIVNETMWETLFRTKRDFIDGFNGDNNCHISYHNDFNKAAEGELFLWAQFSHHQY